MNKDNWTISFFWRPESSWREVHGTLPIALVRFSDNTYLSLYYEATYDGSDNRVGGQFVLTDGVNNITITADSGWTFADVLKFAITQEYGVGTTLSIETPAEGTLADTGASIVLSGYLINVQFSANADGEVKGIGAYGDCQFWDSALSGTDIQKVFDFDATAPAPTLRQTANQMVFARDGVRYTTDLKMLAAHTADKQPVSILARPDVFYDDVSGDARTFCFAHNGVAYCSSTNVLYKTTDGITLTTEIDLSTLDGSDPAVDMIQGGAVLDDGTFLISTVVYGTNNGKIWRKDPSTGEWSLVLTLIGGYLTSFGWTGLRGSEIVIGEYCNPNTNVNEGTRVYYSADYGATWTMIWQRDGKEAGNNMHIHCCAFHPDHTNTIYVSFGDSEFRGIYKVVCTNPSDKSNAASWSFDSIVRRIQPTSVMAYNGKLYWGHDGAGYSALIVEHDPDTESFTPLYNNIPTAQTKDGSPYASYSPGVDVWRIVRIGNWFYAATATSLTANKHLAGLYVSSNLRTWHRIWHISGQSGVWYIDDSGDGRIWLRAERPDGVSRPMVFDTPSMRSIDVISSARSITNLYDKENSIFDTTKGDWSFSADYDADKSGWDDTHKLVGGGALRFAAKVGSNGYALANGPYVSLTAGQRFVISAWVYIPAAWSAMGANGMSPRILLWAYSSGDIEWGTSSIAAALLPGHWHRCVLWGRAINNVDVRAHFNFGGLLNAPEPANHYEVWIDCVQIVKFDDLHYSKDFQPGGTPRAAEILVASAQEVGVAEHIEKRYSSKVLVIPYNGESNLTVVLREYGTGNVLDATTGDCDDTITFAQGCIEATRHAKSGDWLVVVPATDVKTLYGTIYKLAAASVTKNSTSDLPGFLFDSKYGIVFSNTVPTFNGRVLVD